MLRERRWKGENLFELVLLCSLVFACFGGLSVQLFGGELQVEERLLEAGHRAFGEEDCAICGDSLRLRVTEAGRLVRVCHDSRKKEGGWCEFAEVHRERENVLWLVILLWGRRCWRSPAHLQTERGAFGAWSSDGSLVRMLVLANTVFVEDVW